MKTADERMAELGYTKTADGPIAAQYKAGDDTYWAKVTIWRDRVQITRPGKEASVPFQDNLQINNSTMRTFLMKSAEIKKRQKKGVLI